MCVSLQRNDQHSMAKNRSENLHAAFLEKSSRYLSISAPSTSAHLMTERLALMSEDERKSTKDLHHTVCGACGTLAALGWTATTARRQQAGRSTVQHHGRTKTRKVIYVCLACHQETISVLPMVPQAVKTAQAKSTESASSKLESRTVSTISETTEKPSSKRRAKTRKERSGLQALLNKSKQTPASSSTFDLMDFMKA
jgi:RNAse P Rpr2/Rpp21/SNM1 subunit domain